ncbi:MAG: hypothetical protein KDB07_07060 [Planctomycetes bacterium]|nr:hypothetical protein [Planctomycetota bacterium]
MRMNVRAGKALLISVLALSFLVQGCGSSKGDDPYTFVPVIAAAEMIPDPSTVDRQEFDVEVLNNTVYTVWAERRSAAAGDAFDIWFAQSQVGQALTPNAERVTDSAIDSRHPRLAVESGGDVVIVWEEGNSPSRDIATVRRSGGAFGGIGYISAQMDASDDANPDLHIDTSDNLHVVWERAGEIVYRRQGAGATFGNEVTLPAMDSSGTSSQASRPSIITDGNNRPVAVWQAQQTVSGQNISLLRVAASEDGGTSFNLAGRVAGTTLGLGAFEPRLARSASAQKFYVVFRIGKPGDNDYRVRAQRMAGFGAINEELADLYSSTTEIPSGIDIDSQSDEVYATWIDGGEAKVRISVDDGENFGSAVSLSASSGPAGSQLRTAVAVAGDALITVFDAGAASSRAGFLSATDISARNP